MITYAIMQDVGAFALIQTSTDQPEGFWGPGIAGGPFMLKIGTDFAPVSAHAVIQSLELQGIAFRGPFYTPEKNVVFVIESYIFLESELVDLLMQNKLNRDGIRAHSKRIQATNSKVDLLTTRNPTE